MWNRSLSFISLLTLASFLSTANAQEGNWVNVKEEWCNNTCGEGHDQAACLCEYDRFESPILESSWNNCHGVPCCDWAVAFCSLDDPNCDCQTNADRDQPQWPEGTLVNCRISDTDGCSYDPRYESGCQLTYQTSNPNWIYINGASGEQCTGENETGFWSWAAWRSFIWGTDTCTLNQQSPWDDYPLENAICG